MGGRKGGSPAGTGRESSASETGTHRGNGHAPGEAARNATTTIPIVMLGVADAVGSGFVASLARPGGNITGTTNIMPELAGKRLELLREILPKLSRVAFLAYGPDPAHKLFVREAQQAADRFAMKFQPVVMTTPDEIESAFSTMAKERTEALIIQPLLTSSSRTGPRVSPSSRLRTACQPYRTDRLSGRGRLDVVWA